MTFLAKYLELGAVRNMINLPGSWKYSGNNLMNYVKLILQKVKKRTMYSLWQDDAYKFAQDKF